MQKVKGFGFKGGSYNPTKVALSPQLELLRLKAVEQREKGRLEALKENRRLNEQRREIEAKDIISKYQGGSSINEICRQMDVTREFVQATIRKYNESRFAVAA